MNHKNNTWSYKEVEECLQIAAKVDKALPKVASKGYGTSSLMFIRTEIELLWENNTSPARFKPTGKQISIWEDVVLHWFKLLDNSEDKKIVWLRACGMGWTRIGKKVSLSRQTVASRYKKAINELVFRLNRE